MKDYNIFDIIGPIMIGPSSSHTAGACRIGYAAQKIIKSPIVEVRFVLYGSFSKTYKGHGTDVALLGGILGFKPDDERLVDAFKIAENRTLKYEFISSDDDSEHPNTVLIHAKTNLLETWEITGISIGGGKMIIKSINGIDVHFTGEFNTLVTHHKDSSGMLAKISTILSQNRINIAFMKLYREEKGQKAIGIIEADERIPKNVVDELTQIDGMISVNVIQKIYE
ncbi:L-serine ammonia-lyase, iron-sulfur-dependent subunit beta [Fusibacter ferrireducens]|uniref:L-serine deaminase n=1 Tax=Fusibacter ferrireducens TaxID=2785058 RepID=A0ABR9ZRA7_9FIRM|nr:L-serine ammonia-lyase, iron-sulfur-dependent subunit beta [Fusibacter ferrireducens]MBF4692964.1 L-serine ammonia-lyase, iron-sulfur-dependent, subunit beta [Fusibacter ferrireducens]